jgi:hypothetical protein
MSHKTDRVEPAVWDGLTKEINPFAIGVEPGLEIDTKPYPTEGKPVRIPADPRAKKRR